eukprot:GHRQ01009661.1.p2 GENE.GHRQ01009661.1~~GHRQ01009661.1.p2  ORF type:complete len:102 (-),score=18.71 GHRQ01009661.1:262-567(-)
MTSSTLLLLLLRLLVLSTLLLLLPKLLLLSLFRRLHVPTAMYAQNAPAQMQNLGGYIAPKVLYVCSHPWIRADVRTSQPIATADIYMPAACRELEAVTHPV